MILQIKIKFLLFYPNGQSKLVKNIPFFFKIIILPGSTIVVSRDSRPFDAISLTQIITPILADLSYFCSSNSCYK